MSETLESVAIDVDQRQLAEQLLAQAQKDKARNPSLRWWW
jgi:hypothetical protein